MLSHVIEASSGGSLVEAFRRSAANVLRATVRENKSDNVQGGVWVELWDEAPPLPAECQKPLMDPQLEGERVMHWFEHALPPRALWDLLLPVAFSTSAAVLAACNASRLPLVAAELERWLPPPPPLVAPRPP